MGYNSDRPNRRNNLVTSSLDRIGCRSQYDRKMSYLEHYGKTQQVSRQLARNRKFRERKCSMALASVQPTMPAIRYFKRLNQVRTLKINFNSTPPQSDTGRQSVRKLNCPLQGLPPVLPQSRSIKYLAWAIIPVPR